MNGKLIVIEGIDGSGKTTQSNLLEQYLKSKNIPVEVLNFPRYEDNLYGKLIRRYLEGEFWTRESTGLSRNINPYLMALAYAGDRALAKPLIENFLQSGKVVIANRYTPSNKAHMGANLDENKKEEFMKWLDELEFETNRIPKPDLNLFLDVTPKVAQANVRGEERLDDVPSNVDIHEQDLTHLQKAYEIYLELSKAEPDWKVVECMDVGSLKSIDTIHKLVVDILEPFLVS